MASIEIRTETFDGSDCTGSDGDLNRVLTLGNTNLTVDEGFLVFVNGLYYTNGTDYTVVHADTSTAITFLVAMYDDSAITCVYYQTDMQTITLPADLSTKIQDFVNIIHENGESATLKRKTTITGTMGEVVSETNQDYTINWLRQDITNKDRQIHEMGLAIPGNIKAFLYPWYTEDITGVAGTMTPQTGDIIEDGDGKLWRIEQIVERPLADNQIIYILAVCKSIQLEE